MDGIIPIQALARRSTDGAGYPGITGAESLADWDPPFPLDLSKVRDQDEEYWDDMADAQGLHPVRQGTRAVHTRYGGVTSMRFATRARRARRVRPPR